MVGSPMQPLLFNLLASAATLSPRGLRQERLVRSNGPIIHLKSLRPRRDIVNKVQIAQIPRPPNSFVHTELPRGNERRMLCETFHILDPDLYATLPNPYSRKPDPYPVFVQVSTFEGVVLGIQPRVKSLRSSYTGLSPQSGGVLRRAT